MQNSTKTAALILKKKIFWILSLLLVAFASLYIYFLISSIVHVIVYKDIDKTIIATESRLSDLEFAYLSRKNTITLDLAYGLGFSDVTHKEFVNRKAILSQRLSQGSVVR